MNKTPNKRVITGYTLHIGSIPVFEQVPASVIVDWLRARFEIMSIDRPCESIEDVQAYIKFMDSHIPAHVKSPMSLTPHFSEPDNISTPVKIAIMALCLVLVCCGGALMMDSDDFQSKVGLFIMIGGALGVLWAEFKIR